MTNPDSPLCPLCGSKGKTVKRITIESLLTPGALGRTSSRDGLRFCPTPTCDAAYFRPGTDERFVRQDVRIRIGLKESESPRTMCYCFNYTVEEIEADVAETGTSQIPDTITEKCRQGLDRCAETNPQGSCCLGNVRRVLKAARPESSNAASGCCVEDQP